MTNITSAAEDVEKSEPLCIVGGNVKWCSHCEKWTRGSSSSQGSPGGSDGKASARNAGDPGSVLGSGRSPGEGNGNPFQHSCLENPIDGGT